MLGRITSWADPAIFLANPMLAASPPANMSLISIIRRRPGSGSTLALAQYLNA